MIANRCSHCLNPVSDGTVDRETGRCPGCLPDGGRKPQELYQPHPERPHFWYRYPFEPREAYRCDRAGCHARPGDVVLSTSGHDSGYVSFQSGERSFNWPQTGVDP